EVVLHAGVGQCHDDVRQSLVVLRAVPCLLESPEYGKRLCAKAARVVEAKKRFMRGRRTLRRSLRRRSCTSLRGVRHQIASVDRKPRQTHPDMRRMHYLRLERLLRASWPAAAR